MTGSDLKIVRELIGMSRTELADAVGFEYNAIWNWEEKLSADNVKPWVPLALATLDKTKQFKVVDGELYIRATLMNSRLIRGNDTRDKICNKMEALEAANVPPASPIIPGQVTIIDEQQSEMELK